MNKEEYINAVRFINEYNDDSNEKYKSLMPMEKEIVKYLLFKMGISERDLYNKIYTDMKSKKVTAFDDIPNLMLWYNRKNTDSDLCWQYHGNKEKNMISEYNAFKTPYYSKLRINAIKEEDANRIFEVIFPILQKYETYLSYKTPINLEQFLSNLESEEKGNFITLYPTSKKQLFEICKEINQALEESIKPGEIEQYSLETDVATGKLGIVSLATDKDENGRTLFRKGIKENSINREDRSDIYFKLLNEAEENGLITQESMFINEQNIRKLNFKKNEEKENITLDNTELVSRVIAILNYYVDNENDNISSYVSKKELLEIANQYRINEEAKEFILPKINSKIYQVYARDANDINENFLIDVLDFDDFEVYYKKYEEFKKENDDLDEDEVLEWFVDELPLERRELVQKRIQENEQECLEQD